MTDDRTTALFFELFSGLPRQGPGDAASTLRALALVPGVGPRTRVLDLGCGTGLHTRVLARGSPARIVAVDNHAPFVEELNRQAQALGLADRLEARVGDMQLGFAPGSFDLRSIEGAIVLLRDRPPGVAPPAAPGGHMAVTEVCWTRPTRRPSARPSGAGVPRHPRRPGARGDHRACGYETVGHLCCAVFWGTTLPPGVDLSRFGERHHGNRHAGCRPGRREIDAGRRYRTTTARLRHKAPLTRAHRVWARQAATARRSLRSSRFAIRASRHDQPGFPPETPATIAKRVPRHASR
jgi:SAM-dependent methyltransferase